VQIKVKFFAILRERIGKAELIEEIRDGSTVGELWGSLQRHYPVLSDINIRLVYAVNSNYVDAHYVLCDGDEVVFVPPVSGGRRCTDSAMSL